MMKVRHIQSDKDIVQTEDTVLVLGYFDALHKGHAVLFEKARKIAKKEGLKVAVLTFYESPKVTFLRFEPDLLNHITYPELRLKRFEELGVDELYLTDFTASFAKLTAKDFIERYIQRLKARYVVVGFDYKFGSDQADAQYMADHFSGQLIQVPEVSLDGEKISSSRIRQLIQTGQVEAANHLLGFTLSTRGLVVHGDARGRTIGFPTANLAPIDRTFIPADGVYVTDVIIGGQTYRAMTSIGKNVTFGGTELRLEANIFDFDQEIYGQTIEIFWLAKIRDMVKFDGVAGLVEQLQQDQSYAKAWSSQS